MIALIVSRKRAFVRITLSLNYKVNQWTANQAAPHANDLTFPYAVNLLDIPPGALLGGGGAIPPRYCWSQVELESRTVRQGGA